ncbi:MAG: hypothetical protein ACTSRL_09005 [Candidatus Helarchaeota archaeon]
MKSRIGRQKCRLRPTKTSAQRAGWIFLAVGDPGIERALFPPGLEPKN